VKTIAILTAALALTACNKATDVPAQQPTAGAMASMDMSSGTKTGKGSGKVTALDAASGKVTIAHGPIPGVGWPAMTMGFNADPKLLEGIAVGDQVDFDLNLKGNDGTVTALKKR
jgi:Cu(I)/Ag(I) efflux system protein CusF